MKVYEDRIVTARLPPGAAHGHVLIEPRGKEQLQELSEEESAHVFVVASYAAAILFQGLQAAGTNIIVNERPLQLHVIARAEDDGLDFTWKPKELDEGSMSDAEEKIKDRAFYVGKAAPEVPVTESSAPEEQPEENYLLKHLLKNV